MPPRHHAGAARSEDNTRQGVLGETEEVMRIVLWGGGPGAERAEYEPLSDAREIVPLLQQIGSGQRVRGEPPLWERQFDTATRECDHDRGERRRSARAVQQDGQAEDYRQ